MANASVLALDGTAMEHCKGFLTGLKLGAMSAPMLGVFLVILLDQVRPNFFVGEFGYLPDLVTESSLSLPFTCLLGGFLGAVSDYRRDRSAPQWAIVLLLSLPTFLISVWFLGSWLLRFLGREAVLRWLFEHGIWWKGMV